MKYLSRATTALLMTAAVLLLAGTPATAHGGEGEIEITSMVRTGLHVVLDVRLTYVEDGHGVPDATVTAVVDDGVPRPMEPGEEEGDYTIRIAAPPGTTIRVTSVEPATTVEAPAPDGDVTPTVPTTEAPEATEAESTTTTAAAEDEGAAADDEESAPAGPEDAAADDDDGGISPVLIGAIVAVLAAAAVAAALLLRKPKPDEGSGE